MAAIVDRFIHIIQENKISLEEIEKIEATPHAIGMNPMWKMNQLRTEEDYGFNGPYILSCAAHGVKGPDYQSPEVRKDPKILAFMKKVKMLPDYDKDFARNMLEDSIARTVSVEVWARGKSFKETSYYIDWSWRPEYVRPTNDDLIEKYCQVVGDSLPQSKIKKSVKALLTMEKIGNINEITKLLVP